MLVGVVFCILLLFLSSLLSLLLPSGELRALGRVKLAIPHDYVAAVENVSAIITGF